MSRSSRLAHNNNNNEKIKIKIDKNDVKLIVK
jgi:hypothetical protein